MRVLVTGAAGFVGRYLVEALRKAGYDTIASDAGRVDTGILPLDITRAADVVACVRELRPDACAHLAGISFVPEAARNPDLLDAVNVAGAVNVGRALLEHAPDARMLFVSSSQVYGYRSSNTALTEDAPLAPLSPYARSKKTAEAALMGLSREGLNLVIARPGNHTGPGQDSRFVVPAFVAALRRVLADEREKVRVGNLASERDFTDVRDVVAAYLVLLEGAQLNGHYNISSGNHLEIGDLLDKIASLAGVTPEIEVDETLYRPTDATPYLDTSRIRKLGWAPRYGLERTLADIWAHEGSRL